MCKNILYILIICFLIFSVPALAQTKQSILNIELRSSNVSIPTDENFDVKLSCGKYGNFEYRMSVGQPEVLNVDELLNVSCRISTILNETQTEMYSFSVGDNQGDSNGYVIGTPAKEFNGKILWVELTTKNTSSQSSTSNNSAISTNSKISVSSESTTFTTESSGNSTQSNEIGSQSSSETSTVSNNITSETVSSSSGITNTTSKFSTQQSFQSTSNSSSRSSVKSSTKSSASKITSSKSSTTSSSGSKTIKSSSTSKVSQTSKNTSFTNTKNQVVYTLDSNSEKTSESSIENSSDGFITDFSTDDSMPPQEEILGIADEVNKKIGYKETNYWLVSGAALTLLLSLTALAYYVKKNYFLLKLQNNPELSNIK